MTDIQQWRRMIQPSRARTPAADAEEADGYLSPTTPRKGLKPKLSYYFTQYANLSGASKHDLHFGGDLFSSELFPASLAEPYPNPDAENLMESIMCRLLARPSQRLDASFNGSLLQIFECFRNNGDEKKRLALNLQQEIDRRSVVESEMQRSAQQWDRERQGYKAEVKRLELILAKGERGVAEVTLARQDSMLRRRDLDAHTGDKSLETIFEFLERSKRYEDKVWSSQRATMRRRPASPSLAMKRLSLKLTKESSKPNVYSDLPCGPLVEASMLETMKPDVAGPLLSNPEDSVFTKSSLHHGDVELKRSFSDDSISTFSCAGDFLPDETADVNLIEVAGTDNDFVAMKRIAQVLAKRRQLDPDTIMPKLQELFCVQRVEERSIGVPYEPVHIPPPNSAALDVPIEEPSFAKHSKPKNTTLSFFSKRRPQLNIDTSSISGRRFSFEPGDDAKAWLSAPPMENLPAAVKNRLLRKSASLNFISEVASSKAAQPEPTLSPVEQSPTRSASISESKRLSRIPTPVYSSGSLARPRQERENSASSLLTAINHVDRGSPRSSSTLSSAYSSPSTGHIDPVQSIDVPQITSTRSANTNPLLEHTNALRGNTFAAAAVAARVATTDVANVDQQDNLALAESKRRATSRNSNNKSSSTHHRAFNSDMSESRKENGWPMKPTTISRDRQSNSSP